MTLSHQNVLSLTFSNPGNGAITLQYGNTVAALKGGSNVLLTSAFDGTYIQISADLRSCAELVTNDPYKEIALDNLFKISSDGIRNFYIKFFDGELWWPMAQFQYTPFTDQYDLIMNGASLLGSIASKQVAITAASPLLLDSSGNLSIDLSAYETVAAATSSLSLKHCLL